MRRIATPLLVSTLVAAAVAGPAAATAAPRELPPPQTGSIEIPDDITRYTDADLGNILVRQAFLAADGQLSWVYNRQRSADDSRALGLATANLRASGDGLSRLGLSYLTLRGTTALRGGPIPYGSRARTYPSITAVQGGTWVVDHTLTPRPARSRLVKFDDRGVAVQRVTMPKRIFAVRVVPTSRGLRAIGVETVQVGAVGNRRSQQRFVISGPGLRSWVQDKYLDAEDPNAISAVALPDGALLVSGVSRQGLPDPVLRVSAGGSISRLVDRRAPDAAKLTRVPGLASTKLGVVMLEGSEAYSMPSSDLKAAIVVRGGRGQVVARRLVREADLGLPQMCARDGAHRSFEGLLAGPDGLPVLDVRCEFWDSQGAKALRTRSLVGLNEDLTGKWIHDLSAVSSSDCIGTRIVGDHRLIWTIGCDGTFAATAIDGIAPSVRGEIVSSKRDGKAGAVVRIRCKGVYGTQCIGHVGVLVARKVIAHEPYVMPARPGKAAATLDRHIPIVGGIQGRFRTELRLGY